MTKQLYKVIEVVKIDDITGDDMVARELALIRVAASNETRTSILEIAADLPRQRDRCCPGLADPRSHRYRGQDRAVHDLLAPYGIKELSRTGRIAMSRGGGGDDERWRTPLRSAGEGKAQVGSLL